MIQISTYRHPPSVKPRPEPGPWQPRQHLSEEHHRIILMSRPACWS